MLLSTTGRNAGLNAITALLNSGSLKIYTSGNTLLVTCPLNATAFATATTGSATANAITNGTAGAAGTANYATLCNSGGTEIVRLTVGTSGAELNIPNLSIAVSDVVAITSGTLTLPA